MFLCVGKEKCPHHKMAKATVGQSSRGAKFRFWADYPIGIPLLLLTGGVTVGSIVHSTSVSSSPNGDDHLIHHGDLDYNIATTLLG